MKELESHWAATEPCRKEIARLRHTLNLEREDVLAALGGIERLSEYDGSFEDAKFAMADFAVAKMQHLADDLVADDPEHKEAKVIAFTEIFTSTGRKINVTAREGATPDSIALTAISLIRAIQILERAGIRK